MIDRRAKTLYEERVPTASILAAALATLVGARVARAEDSTERRIDAFGGITIADSQSLPGQTEGTSAALGYGVECGVRAVRGRSTFAGDLHIAEGLTFSPLSGTFFKSLDDARLRTSYAFEMTPLLDFAAWASASLPLFGSFLHQPRVVDFEVARADGLVERESAPSLELTQPFLPLRATETVGLAVRPLGKPWLSIVLRAGIGADHALADGQLVVRDDDGTREIEVRELESWHALTPALELDLAGELEERLAYGLALEARMPIVHTTNALAGDRGIPELTMVRARLDLTIQMLPWLTTDYELIVERNPFMSDGVGLGNRLILAAHPFARSGKGAPWE